MKKPMWIRVLGWLSLLGLVYLAVLAVTAHSIVKSSPDSIGVLADVLALFVLCLFVWVISTIIWKVRVSRAEANAPPRAPYWRPTGSPQINGVRTLAGPSWQPPNAPERPLIANPPPGSMFGMISGAQTTPNPSGGTMAPGTPVAAVQPAHQAASGENLAEQSSAEQSQSKIYTYEAPGVPLCPECRERPAVFYCTQHSKSFCLQCVAVHDDPTRCQYVPAFRRKAAQPRDIEG